MSKLVYLSGPITGLTYAGATDWREYAKARFLPGIEGLSPMRAKAFLETIGELSGHGREYQHLNVLASAKGVTTRDRFDTTRSDVMLVNLLGAKRVSIGTMIEFGWADMARRPIVVAMAPDDTTHDHMMVRETAGYIVPTLDEAIDLVNAILHVA